MYKLTQQQKNNLTGKKYLPDAYFNPVQDINGDWFISDEEVSQAQFETWVKNLPQSDYVPPVTIDIAEQFEFEI